MAEDAFVTKTKTKEQTKKNIYIPSFLLKTSKCSADYKMREAFLDARVGFKAVLF